MATGRDDFVIAFRSAFLKKKDKQKFSLLTLIFLSIFVIILGSLDFKIVKVLKSIISDITYQTSFFVSIPEKKFKHIDIQIKEHMDLYKKYKDTEHKLENLRQQKLINDFLVLENEKLRGLISESIKTNETLAKVLIDRESPFLKSIVLNKGSKDKIKIGMAVMDGPYLAGKVIEVNYTNSRALLLSDLNSKIPVLLLPARIQAVASGTGKKYGTIEYTRDKYDDEINKKDRIVYTSGQAGIYKPGIPVGKISMNSDNQIDFFSDFMQLNYVKIVSFNIEGNK